MECRCVECGFRVKTLYIQYSSGNIRLMKCENCKEVADEYIECELMIVLIDLILHNPKAYRHLLCNVVNQEYVDSKHHLWRWMVGYLLLDGYRSLLLRKGREESILFGSFDSTFIKVLMDILLGNFIYICTLALAIKMFLKVSFESSRLRNILSAILISSYFKVFLIAMAVWEFPAVVILIIDLFVVTSNAMALKVITESAINRCLAVCFCACFAKFLIGQMVVNKTLLNA